MLAKKEWFTRRKYTGWGLYPRTWEGWAYISLFVLLVIVVQYIPFLTNEVKFYITTGLVILLIIDTLRLMFNIEKTERERMIEALAERNVAWFMITVLAIGFIYDVSISAINQEINVNWFIVVALIGGVFVKAISNYVLEKKMKN